MKEAMTEITQGRVGGKNKKAVVESGQSVDHVLH